MVVFPLFSLATILYSCDQRIQAMIDRGGTVLHQMQRGVSSCMVIDIPLSCESHAILCNQAHRQRLWTQRQVDGSLARLDYQVDVTVHYSTHAAAQHIHTTTVYIHHISYQKGCAAGTYETHAEITPPRSLARSPQASSKEPRSLADPRLKSSFPSFPLFGLAHCTSPSHDKSRHGTSLAYPDSA